MSESPYDAFISYLSADLAQAEALAREAEAQQKEAEPDLPRLYSTEGYRYCDLLLARGRTVEVTERCGYLADAGSGDSDLDSALEEILASRAKVEAIPPKAPVPADCAARSAAALMALRRAGDDDDLPPGLLAHAEALWRSGDAKLSAELLCEAETIAARGPFPLFLAQAHLLRARIQLSKGGISPARSSRDQAAALIGQHGYARCAPELAVLDAEIACADNAPNREAALSAAFAAIRGHPCNDRRAGVAIDGGWWGLLPRLEALLPEDAPALEALRAARLAYNDERDAYLRSTLAEDVPDYDPEDDPIAAYLDGDEPGPAEAAGSQDEFPEVSDELVLFIFAEARLQDQLRDIMRQKNLSGALNNLPFEKRRAVVAELMKHAVGEAPRAGTQPDGGKVRGSWWQFWRKH